MDIASEGHGETCKGKTLGFMDGRHIAGKKRRILKTSWLIVLEVKHMQHAYAYAYATYAYITYFSILA